MFVAGIFVGYLGYFLQMAIQTKNLLDDVVQEVTDNKIEVKVISSQYNWTFHYPGLDGKFGVTDPKRISEENLVGLIFEDPKANDDVVTSELVLPCGTAVTLVITSADVIHSLSIFDGDYKQDAIPGTEIPMWFSTPDDPTTGILKCAQLCGPGHDDHRTQYRIITPSDFSDWISSVHTVEDDS